LVALRLARDIMAALFALAPDHAAWKRDLAMIEGAIKQVEGKAQEAQR
jgi:hypothetical protein